MCTLDFNAFRSFRSCTLVLGEMQFWKFEPHHKSFCSNQTTARLSHCVIVTCCAVVMVSPSRPEEAVSVTGWETVRGDLKQGNQEVWSHDCIICILRLFVQAYLISCIRKNLFCVAGCF